MSAVAASRRTASLPSSDLRSSTTLFFPTLSWPNTVLQPLRSGGRVRIVSPPSVSILMTSAPMSASIRAQWGPAMVVEKSRTRRPAKAFVVVPSCLSDSCMPACVLESLRNLSKFSVVGAPTLEGGGWVGKSLPNRHVSRAGLEFQGNWTRSCIAAIGLRQRAAILEGLVRYDRNGRLCPRRRTWSRFRCPPPSASSLRRHPDHAARLSRHHRATHAYSDRRA